jgi:uncharacterized membrane protein YgcG
MERRLTEELDDTLASMARGESRETSLARYPRSARELAELVDTREQLKVLGDVPLLAASQVAVRRSQFLWAARAIAREPEQPRRSQRLVGWILPWSGLERSLWTPSLVRVVAVLLIVVGSLGGITAMAQSALPDSPLYGLKFAIEDARLSLTRDPSQRVALNLACVAERTREIQWSVASDREVSANIQRRLEAQLNAALWSAASGGDELAPRLLERIRLVLRTQERSLEQSQLPTSEGKWASLRRAQQAMTQARTQAEEALGDPSPLRYRQGQDPPIEPGVETTHEPDTLASTPQPATTRQPTRTPLATVTSKPAQSSQTTVAPGVALTLQHSAIDDVRLLTRTPGRQATVEASRADPAAQPTVGQGGPTSQPSSEGSGTDSSGGSGDSDAGGDTGGEGSESEGDGPDSGGGAGGGSSGSERDSPDSGGETGGGGSSSDSDGPDSGAGRHP